MFRLAFRSSLIIISVVLALSGRLEQVVGVAATLEILSNLLIAAIAVDLVIDYIPVKVKAPIEFEDVSDDSSGKMKPIKFGEVYVLRKDINQSNLTNLFSNLFFKGDRLPPQTREALINYTNPPYWRSRSTY